MKQYLITFQHDSRHLGYDGWGTMLVTARSFKGACIAISQWSTPMVNEHHKDGPYHWNERFTNARNFINLTIH